MIVALSASVVAHGEGYVIKAEQGGHLFSYWHSGGVGVFEFSLAVCRPQVFRDYEHACYLAQKVGQEGYTCTVGR